MSKFLNNPVVGVDVSADFSMVAMLKPNGDLYTKRFKINHDAEGFKYLLERIKKMEDESSLNTPVFLESTGVYHLTLFRFLKNNGIEVFLLNPLITNSNKNKDIRKEKSDKKDCLSIAKIGKYEDVKVSSSFDIITFTLKGLCREYYNLVDSRAKYKNKLTADLRVMFPGYHKVFSDITGVTSMIILNKYKTPKAILEAPEYEVMKDISSSRRPAVWCRKCYKNLVKAAAEALEIGIQSPLLNTKVSCSLSIIKELTVQIDILTEEIRKVLDSEYISMSLKKNVKLISSIPGIGFISAVTIISEIGDIKGFVKPKQLVAYLGIDPSVSQSGQFYSDRCKMSKRGTPFGRRALYIVALASVRKNTNGTLVNGVLREFYQQKTKSKKKKVALVAVMHKLVNYIFAVLRDQKEYEQRNPEIHTRMYLNNQGKSAA